MNDARAKPISLLATFLASSALLIISCRPDAPQAGAAANANTPPNPAGAAEASKSEHVAPGAGPTKHGPSNKLALVYRGPLAGCEGCSEALAGVLRGSKWGLDVRYVGPQETIKLTADTLKTAGVYAQPGGDGDIAEANALLEKQLGGPNAVLDWVKAGGRYYGACMGGYLAGKPDKAYSRLSDERWPGFNLLPGTVGEWIAQPNASVKNDKETVVELSWKGRSRWAYFQDGPSFALDPGSNVTVLATYKSNGMPAVIVTSIGAGKVALSGPHLEADQEWFASEKITDPDDPDGTRHHAYDLAGELVDSLMQ